MIKKSILSIILAVTILTITSHSSAVQEQYLGLNRGSDDYTHTVLVEFGTTPTCGHCPPVAGFLHSLYNEGYDFYYVTLNAKVEPARTRYYELPEAGGVPLVCGDGGYTTIRGNTGNKKDYENDIDECGQRSVADIDLKLSLTWEDTKIGVSLEVTNNEQSTYDGHIHAYITEIESRWGYGNGDPFHYAMLDYAIHEDITVSGNDKKQYSANWDGANNGYPDITQDNIMIIASVFSSETSFSDETVALKASEAGKNNPPNKPTNPTPQNQEKNVNPDITLQWICNDPDKDLLTYDIYLGTTTNPPKIKTNHTTNNYKPETPLTPGKTYYWKIKAKDKQQNTNTSQTWTFTTNQPPNKPTNPTPQNTEKNINTETTLKWECINPDENKLTYDIYFEKDFDFKTPKANNITRNSFTPDKLELNTTYYWRVVAWNSKKVPSSSDVWSFTTRKILPPPTSDDIDINFTKNIYISGVKAEVKNTGDKTISNISWSISIKGGFFGKVNITKKGKIEILNSNETIEVSTWKKFDFISSWNFSILKFRIIRCFGPININLKIFDSNKNIIKIKNLDANVFGRLIIIK